MTCEGCGNELRTIDHYCPACGKPNTQGKLQPRFEPGVPERELRTQPPEPEAGEIVCPRCEWPTDRRHAWCRHCGMDIELAAMRAARSATTGVWQSAGPHGLDPYRPLGTLGVPLRVLALGGALAAGASVVLAAVRFLTFDRVAGQVEGDRYGELAEMASVSALGLSALVLLATVLWCNRAVRNLPALAVARGRFRPVPAVLGWFVPVLNLWWPRAVVDDLWWRSAPSGPPVTPRRENERPPLALALWWPSLLLGAVLVAVAGLTEPSGAGWDVSTWQMVLALGIVGGLSLTAGLISLGVVVGDVMDRQSLRAERLGPPEVVRRFSRRTAAATGGEDDEGAGDLEGGDDAAVPDAGLREVADSPTTWGRY